MRKTWIYTIIGIVLGLTTTIFATTNSIDREMIYKKATNGYVNCMPTIINQNRVGILNKQEIPPREKIAPGEGDHMPKAPKTSKRETRCQIAKKWGVRIVQ